MRVSTMYVNLLGERLAFSKQVEQLEAMKCTENSSFVIKHSDVVRFMMAA